MTELFRIKPLEWEWFEDDGEAVVQRGYEAGGTRCCECSSMTTAMLADCAHCRAVKRVLKKQTLVPVETEQ